MLLSECDYLVCTFSSQVCRLAYELMQAHVVDASWRISSVDDPWYFGGGNREHVVAVEAYQPAEDKVRKVGK